MPAPEPAAGAGEVTQLLAAWGGGDRQAADRVFVLLYDELRRLARHALASQRRKETLQTTALVHELYVRLVGSFRPSLDERRRFFGAAAKAMRRILIDHARERDALKRGGGLQRVSLDEGTAAVDAQAAVALAVEEALAVLELHDARLAELVELRFYAGFSVEEVAELLGISERTVKREWQKARALLSDRLAAGAAPEA